MQGKASQLAVLREIMKASFAEIKFFSMQTFFLSASIEGNPYEGLHEETCSNLDSECMTFLLLCIFIENSCID